MSQRKQWSAPAAKTWTSDDGRAAMGAWKRSGLTLREFARQHDIGLSKLSWWKRRLEAQGREAITLAPVIATGSTAAIMVRVVDVEVEVRDAEVVPPQWLATLVLELAASRTLA